MHDTPRPAATELDSPDFTLTIEDTLQLYANAGHPRTPRTIQRYCALGHLECRKVTTTLGDKYFVSPQSVTRHIAQIAEMRDIGMRATMHDMSRTVATDRDASTPVAQTVEAAHEVKETGAPHDTPRQVNSATSDELRQGATPQNTPNQLDGAMTAKYMQTIERENEFLREQVQTKDKQITELSARFSETQRLVAGLQRMIAPLLGQADPYRAASPESGEHRDQPLS